MNKFMLTADNRALDTPARARPVLERLSLNSIKAQQLGLSHVQAQNLFRCAGPGSSLRTRGLTLFIPLAL